MLVSAPKRVNIVSANTLCYAPLHLSSMQNSKILVKLIGVNKLGIQVLTVTEF